MDYSGYTEKQLKARASIIKGRIDERLADAHTIFYDATCDMRELEGVYRVLRNRAAYAADKRRASHA